MTPNQQVQLSFAVGFSFSLLSALSYAAKAPDISQLLVGIAMFLNIASMIISTTCGDV